MNRPPIIRTNLDWGAIVQATRERGGVPHAARVQQERRAYRERYGLDKKEQS